MGEPPRLMQSLQARFPAARWESVAVVVAVSGGADSVALLRGLLELRPHSAAGQIIAAHYNHRWRGAASDQDAQFVQQLADRLALPCVVGSASEPAGEMVDRSEEAARDARYAFLEQVAREHAARYVLTAHTADDQVETVLHRILRGTGVAGLAGIPAVRRLGPHVSLVRPLLDLRRQDVLDYLAILGQPCCHDATNTDPAWTRNRIRRELLPQLRSRYNRRVDEALLRLAAQAAEVQEVMAQAAAQARTACQADWCPPTWTLDCSACGDVPPAVRRQMLVDLWNQVAWPRQGMTAAKWEQLERLMRPLAADQTIMLPGGIQAVRAGHTLTISVLG